MVLSNSKQLQQNIENCTMLQDSLGEYQGHTHFPKSATPDSGGDG